MASLQMTGWGQRYGPKRELHEFTCQHCGELFKSVTSRAFDCPNCRVQARQEYAQELKDRRRAESKAQESLRQWNSYRYEVLCDPDPCGGLAAGARFTDRDVQYTLHEGHWTPGMRLLDRKEGGELVVIGEPGRVQALARVAREAGAGS